MSSYRLGSYSVFSLQRLDGICFVTAILTNGFDAVIEASKLELLVQLDCKLVDVNVSWGRLSEDAFHLQDDWGAKLLAFGAAEGEGNLVLFLVISYHVHRHRERHRDFS